MLCSFRALKCKIIKLSNYKTIDKLFAAIYQPKKFLRYENNLYGIHFNTLGYLYLFLYFPSQIRVHFSNNRQ